MVFRCLATLATYSAALLTAQSKPVFTENFESGKLDPAVWEQHATGTVNVTVEATGGAHGKYALHAHYPDMARGYAFWYDDIAIGTTRLGPLK